MKAKTILTGMTNMMNMTMTIMIMTRMMILDHMKVTMKLVKMLTSRPKTAEVRFFQFRSNHSLYTITVLIHHYALGPIKGPQTLNRERKRKGRFQGRGQARRPNGRRRNRQRRGRGLRRVKRLSISCPDLKSGCRTESDCLHGQICNKRSGSCEYKKCRSHNQCKRGNKCRGGNCTPVCR